MLKNRANISSDSPVRFRRRRLLVPPESLFPDVPDHHLFPATRYQGSKLKLLDWIWMSLADVRFNSVLDLFGGTGSVAYLFKAKGKSVTFNDCLLSNHLVGKALIENSDTRLSSADIESIFQRHEDVKYDDFIERTFSDVFFLPEENRWLDVVAQNIARLHNPYKKALAYFSLFQACIAKRPYNLFHRANLYMRTSDVERSFGNKSTWDKTFEEHFRKVALEANRAVFDNGRANVSLRMDFREAPTSFDLVYIDPPYMNANGLSVDYLDFYHFLEGLSEYREWPSRITTLYRHKPYKRVKSPWRDQELICDAFDEVFSRFRESILVVSYRDNGIPSPADLLRLLRRYKRKVYQANHAQYKYVLSKTCSMELLFIAE